MNAESYEAQALRLYPKWSDQQRARWCEAKRTAAHIPPKWAQLVPLTAPAAHADQQFAPRTLR